MQSAVSEGLMRRLAISEDPKGILKAALEEATQQASVTFTIEDGALFIEV